MMAPARVLYQIADHYNRMTWLYPHDELNMMAVERCSDASWCMCVCGSVYIHIVWSTCTCVSTMMVRRMPMNDR